MKKCVKVNFHIDPFNNIFSPNAAYENPFGMIRRKLFKSTFSTVAFPRLHKIAIRRRRRMEVSH